MTDCRRGLLPPAAGLGKVYGELMSYRNRGDAGIELARAIQDEIPDVLGESPIVLGVPRGGVVVAAAVADRLGLAMDVALARKLGAPMNPELAIGALAEGGAVWINRPLVARLGITEAWLDEARVREGRELLRRAASYRDGPAPELRGRTLIVVDDGVATGATLAAVLSALRAAEPKRLFCAVPVAPPSAIEMLGEHCDGVVCPLRPRRFDAVGSWYEDFSQTTDQEVVALRRKP